MLTLTGTTACSDYLDKEPDTELDLSMVFTNRDKVYSMLAYVYNVIHNPDKYALTSDGYEVFADDLTPSVRWRQWDWNTVIPKIFGEWTINSNWNGDLWAGMPKYIRQGYILAENIKALPEQNLPASEVANIKSEIKFLTAYAWWLMAENYGAIPFRPDYIAPTDFDVNDLMIGQSKFDDVVDYCDKQMLEAADALPSVYTDPSKYGRITKVMALTVRARMLLFAASPLVNGNPWYANYRNHDGELVFSSTYDPNKWAKAAEACKLCIDEAEKAGYKLYKELNDDGTIDPFMSTYNVHILSWEEGNKEITFPYTKDCSYNFYLSKTSVREVGGGNGLGVYQGLVDAFFTKNGLPITDPESNYHEEGFSTGIDKRNTNWEHGTGVAGEVTDKGTYNMYCNREPRFYNAVTFNGAWLTYLNRKADFFYNHSDNIRSSSPHDAPQNGYLARKGLRMTDNIKVQWTGRQAFIYRLAFTYLDYAEAENEAHDTKEARLQAIKYVNMIRERAGIRQYTFDDVDKFDEDYIHLDNTQEAVRKAVHMERRVELCCENNRWYDIRRWKEAENLPEMTGDDYGMNAASGTNAETFYKRTVYQTRVWNRKFYWMPVYIDEYDKNPNLVQPPFWTN